MHLYNEPFVRKTEYVIIIIMVKENSGSVKYFFLKVTERL